MASTAKRAATAATNVVRLPTAASRAIRNPAGPARAFRKEHEWPGEFIPGFAREILSQRRRVDEALAELSRTPELAVLLALMSALPSDTLQAALIAAGNIVDIDPDGRSAQIARELIGEAVRRRKAIETLAACRDREGR